MKEYSVKTRYGAYSDIVIQLDNYVADNSVALQLFSRSTGPFAIISVCLGDDDLEENECYIDTNNCPWAPDFLEENELGKATGEIGFSGFCTYPKYKINIEKIKGENE